MSYVIPRCCPPPCPAYAPCMPSAGIKSGLRNCYPVHGLQDFAACGGCMCSCPRSDINPACYKQPRIPDSYAPRRVYLKPTSPVEKCTTYMLSYAPIDCSNLRVSMYKRPGNIVHSTLPMECATTHRMSYQPNQPFTTQPIRPCHHDMWGQGPLQNITTHRHDYVPKPCAIRQSCKPPPKFHCVEQPFENKTIHRMSFIPNPPQPIESYKPINVYERPAAKMESATIHKMSYQPVCAPQPQRPPWACKGQYQKPCQRLESATTYRMSYPPPGVDCSFYMNPCAFQDTKPSKVWCPSTCFVTSPNVCFNNYPKAAC